MPFFILATMMASLNLITLHQIDGREVDVNPKKVTRMMEPRQEGDPKKQLHDKVRCVLYFDGGAYLSVAETCEAVRKLIEKVP